MNHQLAIIGQNFVVSWFAVFTFLGCFAGFLTACILRKTQRRNVSDVFIVTTLGIPFGLICGRIFYCLFAASEYNAVWQMLRLSVGGYGLFGGMLGVFLAAVLTRRMFGMQDWGGLLDCLAIGGALAITAGRFASHFSRVEMGYEVPFEVLTVYSPDEDLHVLAVYLLDGIFEAAVWLICLMFYCHIRKNGESENRGGVTAMLMLALHGANAVIMESMRSDALKLGANDFIKVSQILGITCCVVVIVSFIVMTAKRRGFRFVDALMLLVMIGCIALGVLAEWRVGKGDYIRKHILMFASMALLGVIATRYGVGAASMPTADQATAKDKGTAEKASSHKRGRENHRPAGNKYRLSQDEADLIIDAFKNSAHSEM